MTGAALDFDAVYEDLVEFVWRTVRRMGVRAADADDVVQDVFVIVHRRLAEFEGRAQLKTWVFKILVHEVRHYWRTHQRKPGDRAGENGPCCKPCPPIANAVPRPRSNGSRPCAFWIACWLGSTRTSARCLSWRRSKR